MYVYPSYFDILSRKRGGDKGVGGRMKGMGEKVGDKKEIQEEVEKCPGGPGSCYVYTTPRQEFKGKMSS